MDAHQFVSLILFADGEATNQQIENHRRAFSDSGTNHQILLVDPEARESAISPSGLATKIEITQHPAPEVYANFTDAVAHAEFDTVVIADATVELDETQWAWMNRVVAATTIQTWFRSRVESSIWQRVLLSIYHLLFRWLLGHGKSEHRLGWTLIRRSLARQLTAQANKGHGFGLEDTSQILALAKYQDIAIDEIESRLSVAPGKYESTNFGFRGWLDSTGAVLRFWWNRRMFPARQHDGAERISQASPGLRWVGSCALLFMACIAFFSNLNYPLFEPDEARNAQLAINILKSGDWLSLTLAGEPYWDKPPLQHWAIAISYKIFGVSPFATRIPGALAAALTVWLALLLGQKLIGFRSALAGASMLLFCCGFVVLGRYTTMDASLTLCVLVASMSLMIGFRKSTSWELGKYNGILGGILRTNQSIAGSGWMVLAGLSAGLGLLVKGPVVLVLALPPVIALIWLQNHSQALWDKRWMAFLIPMVLVAAPWYVATAIVHPDFLGYFFWKHHVVRFSDAFNHREPFWYYLPMLMLMMFPASCLLPWAVQYLRRFDSSHRQAWSSAHGFLLIQSMWIIGFFSMAEAKLPTYILPALPPLCLLIGAWVHDRILSLNQQSLSSESWQWIKLSPRRGIATMSGLVALLVLAVTLKFEPTTSQMVPLAWTIGVFCLLTVYVCFVCKRDRIAWACSAIVCLGFVLISTHSLVPHFAKYRSIQLATATKRLEAGNEQMPIVYFGREDYGAEMLLPEKETFSFDRDRFAELAEFLREHPKSIIISSDKHMENLRRALPHSIVLEKSNSTRHFYVSYPQSERVARFAGGELLR